MFTAHLFTWIQGADFYLQLHQEAVAALTPAHGPQLWLDVGCGPGLLARLAAARGYQALGIDSDPRMIAAARRIARRTGSAAAFRVGTVEEVCGASAAVVSAASLLAVLPDPLHGLTNLWSGVRPGGTLLLIEPTADMTFARARRVLASGVQGKRSHGLYLWAAARQGRAVDPSLFDRLGAAHLEYISLLKGLVGAWLLRKHQDAVAEQHSPFQAQAPILLPSP